MQWNRAQTYWQKISATLNLDLPLLDIWDICYISDEKKPLLVCSYSSNVFACDAVNNKLEWNTLISGYSVTTDGRNYVLAVTGYEIKLLSLSDGKDLGYLIREGDQGLGKSRKVPWCSTTMSFVVVHYLNEKYHVSRIQFE